MNSLLEMSAALAALGSGLVAGLCFAFATFILRAFDRLEPVQAIRAMQAINTEILRSSAMVIWFGTALAGLVVVAAAEERTIAIASAVLYILGALVVTGRGNVPLNEALDRIDPEAPDAAKAWRSYRVRWGRLNSLRTVLISLSCVGFCIAI